MLQYWKFLFLNLYTSFWRVSDKFTFWTFLIIDMQDIRLSQTWMERFWRNQRNGFLNNYFRNSFKSTMRNIKLGLRNALEFFLKYCMDFFKIFFSINFPRDIFGSSSTKFFRNSSRFCFSSTIVFLTSLVIIQNTEFFACKVFHDLPYKVSPEISP